jgi:hypothetical protein
MKKLLDKYEPMTCNQLTNYAFTTHENCYINPGYGAKSVCDILNLQNFAGFSKIFDPKDRTNDPNILNTVILIFELNFNINIAKYRFKFKFVQFIDKCNRSA